VEELEKKRELAGLEKKEGKVARKNVPHHSGSNSAVYIERRTISEKNTGGLIKVQVIKRKSNLSYVRHVKQKGTPKFMQGRHSKEEWP